MSHKELDRVEIIRATAAGQLKQQESADRLNICVRQVKRLVQKYRHGGAKALISKHRG